VLPRSGAVIYILNMGTLIFDIETVGESWEELDEVSKQSLTRWLQRGSYSEAERQAKQKDIIEGLGFSPFTGSVVSIAVYDRERKQGAVYFQSDTATADEHVGEFVLKVRTEAEMLAEFWEGASTYTTFVTYNGRMFDVPFLLHRSVINKVQPSVDLMADRYMNRKVATKHVDLADQLSFYGAMPRRASLHIVCRAYSITSPKTGGVSGDDVAELFRSQQFRDIACYNAEDVIATTKLYDIWKQYLDWSEDAIEY